jgi:hypothetical protein
MQRDRYSFRDAERMAEQFEVLLSEDGIAVASGGVLEDLLLSMVYARDLAEGVVKAPADLDPRALLADLVGITDLIQKLLVARKHPDFGKPKTHLELLNQTKLPYPDHSGVLPG